MEPNVEHLGYWVDGLESDEFSQGRYTLAQIDADTGKISNCCLGVACEIAIRHGVVVNKVVHDLYIAYDGHSGELPQVVAEWYGITGNPTLSRRNRPVPTSTSFLNDTGDVSFREIADAIRFTFIEGTPEAVIRRNRRR